MMMVSATPLSPLLMILAVPVGVILTVIGAECALMFQNYQWRSKRLF